MTAKSCKVIEGIFTTEAQNHRAFSACFNADEIAAYYKIKCAMVQVLAVGAEMPKHSED